MAFGDKKLEGGHAASHASSEQLPILAAPGSGKEKNTIRMELVAVRNGVRFINDSKASTMSALAAAVGSGSSKKHLIAGGILKERDVNFVKEILAENCAYVYCIGQAAQKLVAAWSDTVQCEDVGQLDVAVRMASERARSGEDVLLSPGCSSFDQFTSYAQRGEKFKQCVQQCTDETITRKT